MSAISEGLNSILIENQIGKTRAETRKITEEIKQNWQKVAQGWKGLNIQDKNLKLQEFKTEIDAQYPNVWNVAGRAIDDMITEIVTYRDWEAPDSIQISRTIRKPSTS